MRENIRLNGNAIDGDPKKIAALYPWLGGELGARLAIIRTVERSMFDVTAQELARQPAIQVLFSGSPASLTRAQQSALQGAYLKIITAEISA